MGAPFVVTTRSRLRSPLALPRMLVATRRVVDEVTRVQGAARVASIVATPREFWSISVWSSHHAMQEFMRSGAHGEHLWEVGDLLSSFWLMRWRPTRHERGSWDGATLAPAEHAPPRLPPGALDAAARDRVLAGLPGLRAAFGPDGRPGREHAPDARGDRDLLAGSGGVLLRLPPGGALRPRGRRDLRRLRGLLARDPVALRSVGGIAQRGAGTFLLALWRDATHAGRLLDSAWLEQLVAEHGTRLWACELRPENEFGHWDGLRLREEGLLGALGPGAGAR